MQRSCSIDPGLLRAPHTYILLNVVLACIHCTLSQLKAHLRCRVVHEAAKLGILPVGSSAWLLLLLRRRLRLLCIAISAMRL